MCAGVEQVGAAAVAEAVAHGKEHGHQGRGAVHHGRVDDLALARPPGFQQAAHHAEGQQHAAAAEIADQVERRNGLLALFTDRVQRADEADVVDVVTGGLGEGAFLTPTGHAPVDQAFVAGHARFGADAESLGHAGPEAFEEPIGGFAELEDDFDTLGCLQVHGDRAPVARQHVPWRGRGMADPIHPDHLGAHVGEHHAAERARSDAGQLDDAQSVQRSHRWPPPSALTPAGRVYGGSRGVV